MILFNKMPEKKNKQVISSPTITQRRRINHLKRITKQNRNFLLSLGFKI